MPQWEAVVERRPLTDASNTSGLRWAKDFNLELLALMGETRARTTGPVKVRIALRLAAHGEKIGDLDNYAKTILDVLSKPPAGHHAVLAGDRNVTSLHITREYVDDHDSTTIELRWS
jgi:Holliday junction resolvase RusA-like endonuclease